MAARYFALVMGVLFVMAGIGGFIAPITQPMSSQAPMMAMDANYGLLLGLFPINLVHNLLHLSFGIWGLWAWRTYATSRTYCRVMAVILAVLTVMGLMLSTDIMFGLMPLFGHDIWLHGLEAIIAAVLGYWYQPVSATSSLIQAQRSEVA